MTDTPWTPGPWHPISDGYGIEIVDAAGLSTIASVGAVPDADLIAAAPEMAELLERWADGEYRDSNHVQGDTVRLLARIRGEAGTSEHGFGAAVDVNVVTNPYRGEAE